MAVCHGSIVAHLERDFRFQQKVDKMHGRRLFTWSALFRRDPRKLRTSFALRLNGKSRSALFCCPNCLRDDPSKVPRLQSSYAIGLTPDSVLVSISGRERNS